MRRNIVGLEPLEGSTNTNVRYRVETTDVNNSNVSQDGPRKLGDIGDVISIRQRVLNKKWSDTLLPYPGN